MSQETVKQLEEEGEVGADYLEELLDIADLGGDIDIDVDHGRASVAIIPGEDGDERELAALVGRDGEVLEALQELTRLAVQARTGSRSRLMLDIAGYREERRQQLTAIAAEAVKSVLASGKPVALEAMNPFERKVCHDVVANAGLVSESEGVEPHRHVVVLPVDDAEDEVDEAEEGAEVAADAAAEAGAAEAGAAEVGAVESETAEAEAGETKVAESAETVDSPAYAVEEA